MGWKGENKQGRNWVSQMLGWVWTKLTHPWGTWPGRGPGWRGLAPLLSWWPLTSESVAEFGLVSTCPPPTHYLTPHASRQRRPCNLGVLWGCEKWLNCIPRYLVGEHFWKKFGEKSFSLSEVRTKVIWVTSPSLHTGQKLVTFWESLSHFCD